MKFETSISRSVEDLSVDIDAICNLIVQNQMASGEIPWCKDQKTDPWDHVEAAMALSIGGYLSQARRAFGWLVRMQLEDGCWYSGYLRGVPQDRTRDANLSSYIQWVYFTIISSRRILPLSGGCGQSCRRP